MKFLAPASLFLFASLLFTACGSDEDSPQEDTNAVDSTAVEDTTSTDMIEEDTASLTVTGEEMPSDVPTETNDLTVSGEVEEKVIAEPKTELGKKIKGTWVQTHQDCDAEGNGGQEMPRKNEWHFDGEKVHIGKVIRGYKVQGDKIMIGDGDGSPYEIATELDGDKIVLHAIDMEMFMILKRKN